MGTAAFTKDGLDRLDRVLATHAEAGGISAAWVVDVHGETHAGQAGTARPDTIFRISSMTKPVTAVAALLLLEERRLRLDDPVDGLLPELADRRVLAGSDGSLDDTVAADRPITVRDLLTFRNGIGMDFAAPGPQPVLEASARLGLGAGPPQPAGPPAPDEWIRRLGTLPLSHQPGERWLYHTGADILGVLVARASGQPFEAFLRDRVFEPLGMADTGFSVAAAGLDRFGPCFVTDPATGDRRVYDEVDGQWSRPPAFPSGGAGLVSTAGDFLAFARMLRAGGTHDGERILSRASIEAMTTNQLTAAQLTSSSPDPSGAVGWGFGVGVQLLRTGPARSVGTYGWDGGLGSSWANDPVEGLVGILLTDQLWSSPDPPPIMQDFWTCAYAALA